MIKKMGDSGKNRFVSLLVLLVSLFCVGLAHAEDKLVIVVTQDKASFERLSVSDKSFANAAWQQFLAGISKEPKITIRNEDTVSAMRALQKQAEQEVEKGLATDSYTIDKRTLASFSAELAISVAAGSTRLVCTLTNIEKQESFSVNVSGATLQEVCEDKSVDMLAYSVLTGMSSRGIIAPVSTAVVKQLLHEEDSAAAFQKYIDDYAHELQAADAELAALRKEYATTAERLAAEDAARALKLRREMLERNKQVAEENLRRKQATDAAQAKRELELLKMTAEQQTAYTQKIADLEKRRLEIQKIERAGLPLKKRIELIEQSKENLSALQTALDESITQNNARLSAQEEEAVAAKEAEPYVKAELSGGKPTKAARTARQTEIDAIRASYSQQRLELSQKLRSLSEPEISAYQEQIQENISSLEATVYGFRSIDTEDDYLSLVIDEYDGEKARWVVHSYFQLDGIPRLLLEKTLLPDTAVTYTMMTGEKVPNPTDTRAWKAYGALVENADLYFRTDVPYLYSEMTIKIKYSDKNGGLYTATPQRFKIFKTEDNSIPLLEYSAKDFARDKKAEESRLARLAAEEQARIEAARKEEVRLEKQHEAAVRREQRHETRVAAWNSFVDSQRPHYGFFFDAGYLKTDTFYGLDTTLWLLFPISKTTDRGTSYGNWFFGGGMDLMGLYLEDGRSLNVASHYKTRDDFAGITGFGSIGWTLTLGSIAPYVGAGFGGYSFYVFTNNATSSSSSSSYSSTSTNTEPITASLQGGVYALAYAGVDIRIARTIVLGGWYKLKYFSNSGFADSFGASIGLRLY